MGVRDEIEDRLAACGWVHFRASARPAWNDLAAALNLPVHSAALSISSDLRPYDQTQARPGSMSSKVGLSEQPPHTDGAFRPTPPRFLVFECVNPGEEPCPTHLWALDWPSLAINRPSILFEPTWLVRLSQVTHSTRRFSRCA